MSVGDRQFSLQRLFLAVSSAAVVASLFCTSDVTAHVAASLIGWFGLVWIAAWLWFVASYQKPPWDEFRYRMLAAFLGFIAGISFLPICLMGK
jgi:hypothetical protein